jgi:hypothetical protein
METESEKLKELVEKEKVIFPVYEIKRILVVVLAYIILNLVKGG